MVILLVLPFMLVLSQKVPYAGLLTIYALIILPIWVCCRRVPPLFLTLNFFTALTVYMLLFPFLSQYAFGGAWAGFLDKYIVDQARWIFLTLEGPRSPEHFYYDMFRLTRDTADFVIQYRLLPDLVGVAVFARLVAYPILWFAVVRHYEPQIDVDQYVKTLDDEVIKAGLYQGSLEEPPLALGSQIAVTRLNALTERLKTETELVMQARQYKIERARSKE